MTPRVPVGAGPADVTSLPALGVAFEESRRVFPAPLIEVPPRFAAKSGGRKSCQRRSRSRRLLENANDAIRGLNWLAHAGEPQAGAPPSELQARVQARALGQSRLYQPAAATISREAAFQGLLKDHALYCDAGVCPNLATFTTTANVSMPTDVEGAPLLDGCVPAWSVSLGG